MKNPNLPIATGDWRRTASGFEQTWQFDNHFVVAHYDHRQNFTHAAYFDYNGQPISPAIAPKNGATSTNKKAKGKKPVPKAKPSNDLALIWVCFLTAMFIIGICIYSR